MGRKCERCSSDLKIVEHKGKQYYKKCHCKAMDAIADAIRESDTEGANFFHTGDFLSTTSKATMQVDCVTDLARFKIQVGSLALAVTLDREQAMDLSFLLEDFLHQKNKNP